MIVSTTLTGSNADIIGDALASVLEQVDRCIVIDTGAKDDTVEVARCPRDVTPLSGLGRLSGGGDRSQAPGQ